MEKTNRNKLAASNETNSPLLQTVLKKSSIIRSSSMDESFVSLSPKKKKKRHNVPREELNNVTQCSLENNKVANVTNLIEKLSSQGELLDKTDLQLLFSSNWWFEEECGNKICSDTETLQFEKKIKIIAYNCSMPTNRLLISLLHKLLVEILVKRAPDRSSELQSFSMLLIYACVEELCSTLEGRRQFLQSVSHNLMTKFSDASPLWHRNLLNHFSAPVASVDNKAKIGGTLVHRESLRTLALSVLPHFETKYFYGKKSVRPTIEVYMDFLLRDVMQKNSDSKNAYDQQSSCNQISASNQGSSSGVNASEAKATFSFFCRKLKDFVYNTDLRYLPFVYVCAASIHDSFHEHLARVLWESFSRDHSLSCLHWLISFICDVNLIQLPMVQDLMRHCSLFLCQLHEKVSSVLANTRDIIENASKSQATGISAVENTSEQFVTKQAYVYGFYALVEFMVQFEYELLSSAEGVAFVQSLSMDKFIGSELNPLSLIPAASLKQFIALTERNTKIFPNIRLFTTYSRKLLKEERRDLKVEPIRPFKVKFDLESCKWAVSPHLRVEPLPPASPYSCVDSSPSVSIGSSSLQSPMLVDEDSRMSSDVDSLYSSSFIGSEHRLDVTDCSVADLADLDDELTLYSSCSSQAQKAIASWKT